MQLVANRVVKLLPVRSLVSFRDVVAIQVWEPNPCQITAGSLKSMKTSTFSILPYLKHLYIIHNAATHVHIAAIVPHKSTALPIDQ